MDHKDFNILPICSDEKLSKIFIKAHADLGKKCSLDLKSVSLDQRKKILENLWLEEYGVTVIKDNNMWKHLSFDTDTNFTLFCLRWG